MTIDWEALEAKYSFKQVEDGEYTTQVLKAEVADEPTQSGSYAIQFELKDLNGTKFPYSSSHWLSFKEGKDDWRCHHMKALLLDMGVSEENARKHIDKCEDAGTKDQIVAAYRKMFATLASKHPSAKVKVETQPYVRTDKESQTKEIRLNGHRTEFAGVSYMPPQTLESLMERNPGVPIAGEAQPGGETQPENVLGGEAVNIDDIPF